MKFWTESEISKKKSQRELNLTPTQFFGPRMSFILDG